MANALRRAGGERGDRAVGEEFTEAAELPVFGAEVMSPLGDAMRFVDGEERYRHTAKPGGSSVEGDALGRKVQKTIVALAGAAKYKAPLLAGKRAIQKAGGHARGLKLREVVLRAGHEP